MKTIGQLADKLSQLFDIEEGIKATKTMLERPMLPAKRAELEGEVEVLSAQRDALRAEELAATLHKP